MSISIAGCQAMQGDGPLMNGAKAKSTTALPFDVIDLTPTTVVAYRAPTTVDRPSTTGNLSAGAHITASPGDVLKVRVFERYEGSLFPTLRNPASADLGFQRVTDDGTIEVPYAGVVHVAGMDLGQIERQIVKQLGSKAKDPQVIVEFGADRTNTVMVSGNVKLPGRVSLLEGTRSVVDAINHAGGVVIDRPVKAVPKDEGEAPASSGSSTPSAGPPVGDPVDIATQLEVVVRRDGNVILDKQYSELLAGGDIAIQKGDEIVVRPNARTFTVLGAVVKAGNVEMSTANMPLAKALGAASGLFDLRANKTGIYIFRMGDIQDNPDARARIFRLDLLQPSSVFVAEQFNIRPRDVIYVSNAPLYEYDKIVTSLYRTFSVVGALQGNITTSIPY